MASLCKDTFTLTKNKNKLLLKWEEDTFHCKQDIIPWMAKNY